MNCDDTRQFTLTFDRHMAVGRHLYAVSRHLLIQRGERTLGQTSLTYECGIGPQCGGYRQQESKGGSALAAVKRCAFPDL